MPGKITDLKRDIRRRMSELYSRQKNHDDGYDDWGEYTAHIVYMYQQELDRVVLLAQDGGVVIAISDPLEAGNDHPMS